MTTHSDPLTDDVLAAIRARSTAHTDGEWLGQSVADDRAEESADDVPALLDEVDRRRDEVARFARGGIVEAPSEMRLIGGTGCVIQGYRPAYHSRSLPMPSELTPAEQAVAEALQYICWHTGPSTDPESLCGECDKAACAVVAAVRPEIYDEIATKLDEVGFLSGERAWPFAQLMREMATGRRKALRAARQAEEGQ